MQRTFQKVRIHWFILLSLFGLIGCVGAEFEDPENPLPHSNFGYSTNLAVEYAVAGLCVSLVKTNEPLSKLIEWGLLDLAHPSRRASEHHLFKGAEQVYKIAGYHHVYIAEVDGACEVLAFSGTGPELLAAVKKGLSKRNEEYELYGTGIKTRRPETERSLWCSPSVAEPSIGVLLTTQREDREWQIPLIATVMGDLEKGECYMTPVDKLSF